MGRVVMNQQFEKSMSEAIVVMIYSMLKILIRGRKVTNNWSYARFSNEHATHVGMSFFYSLFCHFNGKHWVPGLS